MEEVVDSLTHLKELYRKMHDDGNVSVMVGAGFSKNVSNKFLSWSGLLADMLKELYPEEFEAKKKIKVEKINRIDTLIKIALWSKENQELINEYKTNKIFSSAITRALTSAFPDVEIPVITENDNDAFVALKTLFSQCFKKESFYEFFKQELTDVVVEDVAWEMMRRRDPLEIVSEYQKKKGYREAVENYLETHIPNVDFKLGELILKRDGGNDYKIGISDLMDVHSELLKCPWQYIFTTNYDQLLEYTYYVKGSKYKVVTHDYDLTLNNMEDSIIKLHGDLAALNANQTDFSFDGCNDHRYIFSKEDYEKYPTDHEAFTQFMKIVLLRGSICLIGFSGDDPNFMSWIKWIRKILIKSPNGYSPKIYFISLEENELSQEKKRFYYNHNVAVISLFDVKIKNILIRLDDSNLTKRNLLKKFFSFIMQKESCILDDMYKVLEQIFTKKNILTSFVHQKNDFFHQGLKKLEFVKKRRLNPYFKRSWSFWDTDSTIETLDEACFLIHIFKLATETTLYYDCSGRISVEILDQKLQKVWSKLDNDMKTDYSYQKGLIHVLTNQKNINNVLYFEIESENYRSCLEDKLLIYLECLDLAYSFNFEKLIVKLDFISSKQKSLLIEIENIIITAIYRQTDVIKVLNRIKKLILFRERIAMLISLYDTEKAVKSLKKINKRVGQIPSRITTINDSNGIAKRIKKEISNDKDFSDSTISQLINTIKTDEILIVREGGSELSLNEHLEILVTDFRKYTDKHYLDSYSKYSHKTLYAFRILRFMQEYGAGIGTPNFPKPPFEIWYEVVKILYKQCTNSVLYYSLMYSYDEIQRIALLYASFYEEGRGIIIYSIFKAIGSNYTIPNDYENKVKLLAVIVIFLTFNPSNSKDDFELTDEFVKTIVQDYCEYARSIIDEKQDVALFKKMSYLLYSFFPLFSPKQLDIFFSYLIDWYIKNNFEDNNIVDFVFSVFSEMRLYTVLIDLKRIDFNELSELNCKLSCFIEKMGSSNDFQLSFTFLPFIIPLNLAQKYIKRIKEVHGNGDIHRLYSLSQGHIELLYKVYNSQSKNETPKDKSLEDYIFNAFINEDYFWEPINVGYLYYSESFVTPWGSSNEISLSSSQICRLYDSLLTVFNKNRDEITGQISQNDYVKKKYWIVLKEMQSFMDKYKDEISETGKSYECTKRDLEELLNHNYEGWDIKACLSSSSLEKQRFAIDKTRYKVRTNSDLKSYWRYMMSLVDSCCYSNDYLSDKMAVICEACCKRSRNNKLKHDISSLEPLYLKFMQIDLVEIADDAYFVFNCLNRIAKLFPKEQIKSDVIKDWLDNDRSKIYKTIEMNWL